MREIVSDLVFIALALILLTHLLLLQVFHSVLIYENNECILVVELVLALGVFGLSIDRIVDDLKALRKK